VGYWGGVRRGGRSEGLVGGLHSSRISERLRRENVSKEDSFESRVEVFITTPHGVSAELGATYFFLVRGN